MLILVTVETILLVLLALLVAGLLRSHAEILRRLGPAQAGHDGSAPGGGTAAADGAAGADLPPAREHETPVFDVAGTDPAGGSVAVAVAGGRGRTLLAFLTSGCRACGPFWEGLRGGAPVAPEDARVVVVTKDRSHESPSRLLELEPRDVPVVMSSRAWEDYRVQGSPYFILVDGPSRRVLGEGTAETWPQVLSLVRDADLDAHAAANGRDGSMDRLLRAERELRAAGIEPGHPSLYALDGDGAATEGNGAVR